MSMESLPSSPRAEAPLQQNEEELAPHGAAEVLSNFKRVLDDGLSHPLSPEERGGLRNTLHGIAEQFDNQEMLVAYEEGRVPTFSSMEQAVADATAHLEPFQDDPEILAVSKLLSQRVKEIRRWCLRYEQSIIVFHNKLKKARETGQRDDARMFEEVDIERRRIHENLLSSIQSLDQTLAKANDLEPLPVPIRRWDVGNPVPNNYANEHALIFGAKAASHDNRAYIRDWALIANLEQKMNALQEYEDNREST